LPRLALNHDPPDLTSASQVARVTGVSHQRPAEFHLYSFSGERGGAAVLGFELRALCLLGTSSTTRVTPPALHLYSQVIFDSTVAAHLHLVYYLLPFSLLSKQSEESNQNVN
jgi:hypothetical protein